MPDASEKLQHANLSSADEEISLLEIIQFIRAAWKTIALTSLLGFVIAIAYILLIPSQYEASAQIAMTQIANNNNNNNNNNNMNPLGLNIEEPNLLMSRMSLPTSYSAEQISACDLQNQSNAAQVLAKKIQWTLPKGVANVVQVQVTAPSPQAAMSCVQSLVDLIKTSQKAIMLPYIAEAKTKLATDQERLDAAKKITASVDKSGVAMGAAYLSTRDEIRFLLDEMTGLQNLINLDERRSAHLIAPIYASQIPVWPKKKMALTAGFLGGLFTGLLLALARRMWVKLQGDLHQLEQAEKSI